MINHMIGHITIDTSRNNTWKKYCGNVDFKCEIASVTAEQLADASGLKDVTDAVCRLVEAAPTMYMLLKTQCKTECVDSIISGHCPDANKTCLIGKILRFIEDGPEKSGITIKRKSKES